MTLARRLASLATAVVVATAIALRIADPFGLPGPSVSALVPILWGLGALVVLVLVQSWAPTLAWAAAIVGSAAGALADEGIGHEAHVLRGSGTDPWLDALVIVALLMPAVIGAAYATSDGGRPRAVIVSAWLAVAVIGVGFTARFAVRASGGDIEGWLPEWAWLAVVGLLTLIGLVRDLRPAFARTRVRVAAGERGGSRTGGAWSMMRVFVDEVVPGRDIGRAEAVESERGRLAADLHAEVLPLLRRALAAAEAGGTVERLAADLRTAVDEVESLLMSRRSIVLEEMGLLAAMEWLAERVEDRSTVRVEIEVEGAAADGERGARPPRDAERAAFRVAQLALDNVIRHAPGSTARVFVLVQPGAIRLRIEDDGEGPQVDEVAAARAGRRGIADMRAEARACGGALDIGRGPGDRGTAVSFRWPA